jgi:hypothetical protein
MSIMKARQSFIIIKEEAKVLYYDGVMSWDEYRSTVLTLFRHCFMMQYRVPLANQNPAQMGRSRAMWAEQQAQVRGSL